MQSAQPVPEPSVLRLRLDARALPATVLGELKEVLVGFPGESDVVIDLATSIGRRRLRLGPSFRVARSAAGLHAELDALLGPALLADAAIAEEPASAAAAGA